MKDICAHGDHQDVGELEIVEYLIGGYRFGAPRHHVIDSDSWHPNYLNPILSEDKAIMGTMLYRGEPILVIDLRHLFSMDQESDISTALFYTVVKYNDILFTILHDGFLGISQAPPKHFRLFKSLYVLGVRWLSGIIIFDEYLVIMLNLEALSTVSHAARNISNQTALPSFIGRIP